MSIRDEEGRSVSNGVLMSNEDMTDILHMKTVELEATKTKADGHIKQLLQLLQITARERDEARDQLQKVLNKILQPTTVRSSLITSNILPERPTIPLTRCGSSIAESISSSQVNSFLCPASSSDIPSMNIADSSMATVQQAYHLDCTGMIPKDLDQAALAIIDGLAAGKKLPEKGKLKQAMMEAGPLLRMLLVAGPLPQWRNPPPMLRHLQIPPTAVKGHGSEIIKPNAIGELNQLVQNFPTPINHDCPIGGPQDYFVSALNFSGTTCTRKRPLLSSAVVQPGKLHKSP